MAVSGVLLMGRAPVVARGLGRSPYQALRAALEPRLPADLAAACDASSSGSATATGARERRARPQRRCAARARGAGRARTAAWLLAVCCVAQFMVILDLSIVNVALPSIQSSLGFSSPDLQWVVDAYAITFAGFLMLGGRVADHFGQRRMFVRRRCCCSALASLAGGLAPDQARAGRRARAAGHRAAR